MIILNIIYALTIVNLTVQIFSKHKTAQADYFLSVKDNHPNLKKDIEDFFAR